jgi:hypothetical protein
MTDANNPTTETVTTAAQVQAVSDVETPTQPVEDEAFDKARAMDTIHKLREAEKEAKKQLKELEALKAEKVKRDEAEMTELQKLQKQAGELAQHNAKLAADILRRDVIAETGLPSLFASRLQGATKEEMLADAEELKKALPTIQNKAPHLPATNPANAQAVETDAQKRERLFGRQNNIFDVNAIKESGGGVVWHEK